MAERKDLSYQSATELVAALANKDISAVELLERTISRIEQIDKKINAVVVRDFERACIAAKAADVAIARGERQPLLGLPITIKESFNIAGLPTTWGNPQFKNWQPEKDALVVKRLKEAGAIIIGKTNISFMLGDWQSYNDVYGTTNNPWDIKLTPGGSSGGSAAALAAGFVSLELGSDLAGSVRTPAHYCGIFAHKPTLELIPLRGSGPPTSPPLPNKVDLAVAGPMARSAADLKLALDVLAGPDEMTDGKGYKLSLPSARHHDLKNFRVLVLDSHPLCPTATEINDAIHNLADRLFRLGVTVSSDAQRVPDLTKLAQTYTLMMAAFVVGNMPNDAYEHIKDAANNVSPDDTSFSALFLRGCIMSYRDWIAATRIREHLRQQWRNLFKEFDVVLCPPMPNLAIAHDHAHFDKRKIKIDNTVVSYDQQKVWVTIASFLGLPATIMPIATSKNGLPIGVQIIGDYLEDYTTIEFAKLVEREFGGFSKPPLS